MDLPKEYRRKGVSLGDVGILYSTSFCFLFNIFLPADHPINSGRVPLDFKPLSILPELNRRNRPIFNAKEFLNSTSVQPLGNRSGYVQHSMTCAFSSDI